MTFLRNILLIFLLIFLSTVTAVSASTNRNVDDLEFTVPRNIDARTFNEYRYRLTQDYFALRGHFRVHSTLNPVLLRQMLDTANEGYNFLPDDLINENLLRELTIEIRRWLESQNNEFIYNDIVTALTRYIRDVNIEQIQWNIAAIPLQWNAPLTTTFRMDASDPTWSQIRPSNIRWWMNDGWREILIWRWVSVNHTFRDEGRYTVFADVTSIHTNSNWNTDVLPLRSRVDVVVNEQVAAMNIRVNSDLVRDNELLKFTPEVSNFWLVIDATNSIPSWGARFTRTEWNFWNGITKSYDWPPRIERARYANEWEYDVSLRLETNEWRVVETEFTIYVNNPVAKIEVNREEWFIGDRFNFSAKTAWNDRNVSYTWEIIDIQNDRVLTQQSDQSFNYTFNNIWNYNVRLRVRKSSWETDQDTRVISVQPREPIAEFNHRIPERNKPNRVFLDATRSYDPDISDNWRLQFVWYVDGERIELENPSQRWSTWFYTFPTVWTYSVVLEAIDPNWLRWRKEHRITIDSILSVSFEAFPQVIQRNWVMRFVAESPEARVLEWNFWDGTRIWWNQSSVSHRYETSWAFEVTLQTTDRNNNRNSFTRTVYVSDSDSPLAFIDTTVAWTEIPDFDQDACDGNGAFIVDRVRPVRFDASESINIDGTSRRLSYSWRIWANKFATSQTVNHRFDEIGCFPVTLTVRSETNWRTDRVELYAKVENLPPTLTSLDVRVQDEFADPVIVEVNAQWARDPDGVVQSYMWYYYTQTDPEPQDLRATRRPSTTFTLPRITGEYYFVAVLRDNNEERITSEEITWSRHFITLTGDNLNTPIVWLSVDRNSISVWDEVTFRATANNILMEDISWNATYHWDFNGDGFYNMQTTTPTASHIYRNSWEFFAKVKVTHRWMSSTRNVTIDVTNRLRADFWYFSIWNRFIFFDTSSGQIASRQWDIGNTETRSGNNFVHTFADGKTQRDVTLTVSEGTRVDEITKTVRNNPRNVLRARQSWLVAFTFPERNDDSDIFLEAPSDRVFVYMGESSEASEYVIDFDIDFDSNLDGSRDTDEDNRGTPSFINGSVIEIPLNEMRDQTMRLFLRDEDGAVFASEDITIIKDFIEDQTIDPDTIIFDNVTQEEKIKLERLKELLSGLPKAERLQSFQYVQRLQQNWFDKTEKTRIIIDFENYIFELNLNQEDEIIDILESLLVTGQEDRSQLQIIYQALVNLVPENIDCEVETWTCYDNILSKLADIRQSDDIEYNRELGREILQVIADLDETIMSNSQKLDFRAILITLVYRGDVNAIPEDEQQEIIEQTPTWSRWLPIFSYLINISLFVWAIFWVFLFILLVLYLIYRSIYSQREDVTFQQFILRKTWWDSQEMDDPFDNYDDILWDIDEEPTNDILSSSSTDTKSETISETPDSSSKQKDTEAKNLKTSDDSIPSWLKWSSQTSQASSSKKEKVISPLPKAWEIQGIKKPESTSDKAWETKNDKKEDIEENSLPEDSQIPDWLKWSFDASSDTQTVDEDVLQDKQDTTSKNKQENNLQNQNKIENKDILYDNFDTDTSDAQSNKATASPEKTQKVINDSSEKLSNQEDNLWNKKSLTQDIAVGDTQDVVSQEELNIPDWLKWSFEPSVKKVWESQDIPESQEKSEKKDTHQTNDKKTKVQKEEKASPKKTVAPTRKQRTRTSKKADISSSEDKNSVSSWNNTSSKNSEEINNSSDELWDDGMKIPDWLKAPDDWDKK